MKHLTIATRNSPLALCQANLVKTALEQAYPYLEISLLGMTTEGDRLLDSRLSKIGGKGLFVKELEKALLDGRADIAVHSIKDLPAEWPEGLMLGAICEREDPRDAFVSSHYANLGELPPNSIIGTASLRRQCQLHIQRPDLIVEPLRGNINTRLQRLDEGKYAAIILAAAGLLRMNMSNRIRSYLSIDESIPAVGQGALGIECRIDDTKTRELIISLDHYTTRQCILAERAMTQTLGGGCHVPIGGYAFIENKLLTLQGMVGSLDGRTILKSEIQGPPDEAETLGMTLGQDLIAKGAKKILAETS